jgi:hypothetical protein
MHFHRVNSLNAVTRDYSRYNGGALRHTKVRECRATSDRALLENTLGGRVITVDLLSADGRQLSAACGELSTT